MSSGQSDNSTFEEKSRLRAAMLRELGEETPVVMETHGGYGKLYQRCYRHVRDGVVFEKLEEKTDVLASQRPTWAVYEGDCVKALRAGAGAHLTVNFVDMDPYGSPWDAVDAFFESDRPRAKRLILVVNDGLRVNLRLRKAWTIKALAGIVEKYGNEWLYPNYLKACRMLVTEKAGRIGYKVNGWTSYCVGKRAYTGGNEAGEDNAHYAARLEMA